MYILISSSYVHNARRQVKLKEHARHQRASIQGKRWSYAVVGAGAGIETEVRHSLHRRRHTYT